MPKMNAPSSTQKQSQEEANAEAPTILVIDDEPAIADLVVEILSQDGYRAIAAYAGAEAIQVANELNPDLYILDIMMPNIDGMEVLQKVREFSLAPVLLLSAKDAEADKVVAFSLGADDYIEKPFKKRELLARVEAHLRRVHDYRDRLKRRMVASPEIELSSERHEAFYRGAKLDLTPKEFEMLRTLLEAEGKPVSTETLYECVWNEKPNDSAQNTIMVHIRNLRKKLQEAEDAASPAAYETGTNISAESGLDQAAAHHDNPIQTVWGIGYKIG